MGSWAGDRTREIGEKFTLFVTTGNPKGFGHKNATAGDGGSMLLAGRRLGGMDGGPEGPPGRLGCLGGGRFLEFLFDEFAEVGVLIVGGDERHELTLDLGIAWIGGAQVGQFLFLDVDQKAFVA